MADDWLQSRTTWSAVSGIAGVVLSEFCHKPELVGPIAAIFGFLAVIFARDAAVRKSDEMTAAAHHAARAATDAKEVSEQTSAALQVTAEECAENRGSEL